MPTADYSLHFYPDKNNLEVKNASGVVVATFEAWGGDMDAVNNNQTGYEPTNKGTFIIQVIDRITTKRWGASVVPWGERVIINARTREVLSLSRKYLTTLPDSYEIDDFKKAYIDMPAVIEAINRGEEITVPYRFNDFGHIGIKTFSDLNGNGRYDHKTEPINPHYIHPTPDAEWNRIAKKEKALQLGYSHGCIHMYPSDIDTLINTYIQRRETTVTVH